MNTYSLSMRQLQSAIVTFNGILLYSLNRRKRNTYIARSTQID